ncbi:MAG TPA: transcriptional regulator NrdR [Candidatus Ligilactobacillus avistercoris]|nr:transcriptional regulator NrdR [Candidatus Ligilactobacillus avistercoris]
MKCPNCQSQSSRVVDSRPADSGRAIRRRRECEKCGYRFTTFERIEVTPLLVVKKDGTRQEFNRDKVMRGIMRATEKLQISSKQITAIVDKVEARAHAVNGNEISSQQIGEYVMEILADVDDVAYIRFASVYHEFKDMQSFAAELNDLLGREARRKERAAKEQKDD